MTFSKNYFLISPFWLLYTCENSEDIFFLVDPESVNIGFLCIALASGGALGVSRQHELDEPDQTTAAGCREPKP